MQKSWRNYQQKLKKTAAVKSAVRTSLKYLVGIFFLFLLAYKIMGGSLSVDLRTHQTVATALPSKLPDSIGDGKLLLDKKAVQVLLNGHTLTNLNSKNFDWIHEGQRLNVETSLDPFLQGFIQPKIDRTNSRYIGIIVMNPLTGNILSMISFDKTNPSNNPTINQYPAASIFKIVTAAAAIEQCGFNQNTELLFNGNKHTLYKSQLKERVNKYTCRTTLQEAFAQSINPVFGKIGTHYLDGSALERYGIAFGFNQKIGFEIPLSLSRISLSEEPYHWAEIASGFNNDTTISPLHAALIGSAIINQGNLLEPTIIDKITNENGKIIYRSQITTVRQAMTPETSVIMNRLMEATIQSGTAKKSFRGYQRDKILSKLNIGGKTGSIDNKLHDARYDWFVGFAEEKDGPEKIVLSIFVAHEKYIGIRASQYARIITKEYFRNYFEHQTVTVNTDQQS